MTRIKCETLFDITPTGVTGHFKSSRIPFTDSAGNKIIDIESWNRSRNQQRNYETILQVVGLRTQVTDITNTTTVNQRWSFEFSSDTASAFGTEQNPVSVLESDSEGVPMLVDSNTENDIGVVLVPNKNIWFTAISP